MEKFGLLGRTLKHSYSKEIHNLLGDYAYDLYELEPNELGDFVKSKKLKAFNVTIPYKKDVMEYLDKIDESAQLIGAVNTVVERNGHGVDDGIEGDKHQQAQDDAVNEREDDITLFDFVKEVLDIFGQVSKRFQLHGFLLLPGLTLKRGLCFDSFFCMRHMIPSFKSKCLHPASWR